MWAQRPIVEKHNRYRLYHRFTDAISAMICDLPNKITTAIIFQIALYFMTHLRRTPAAFFTWMAINFVLVLNMSMWFRFIGSISRTMAQSTAPTCILVLLSCIYAGFVVPVPYMAGWLQWFRRGNPIAYAYESLMINEVPTFVLVCCILKENERLTAPSSSTIAILRVLPCPPAGPSYDPTILEGKTCPVVGAVNGEPFVSGDAYIGAKYAYEAAHLWR